MDFNIKKYDDRIFHEDELTHKRMKALLLWYEWQAHDRGLGRKGKLGILTNIINMSVRKEWYEIAAFFTEEKEKVRKR